MLQPPQQLSPQQLSPQPQPQLGSSQQQEGSSQQQSGSHLHSGSQAQSQLVRL
jgi:hypothetical protein